MSQLKDWAGEIVLIPLSLRSQVVFIVLLACMHSRLIPPFWPDSYDEDTRTRPTERRTDAWTASEDEYNSPIPTDLVY